MGKGLELDVLQKALLFECECLLENKTVASFSGAQTFRKVTVFYTQIRSKFKYVVAAPSHDISRGIQKQEDAIQERRLWLEENDIIVYLGHEGFCFITEEDATAFKLRWDE